MQGSKLKPPSVFGLIKAARDFAAEIGHILFARSFEVFVLDRHHPLEGIQPFMYAISKFSCQTLI